MKHTDSPAAPAAPSKPTWAQQRAAERQARFDEIERRHAPYRKIARRLALLSTEELLLVVARNAHARTGDAATTEGTIAQDIVDLRLMPALRGTHQRMVKALVRSPSLRENAERRGTRRQRRAAAKATGIVRKAQLRARRAAEASS